MCHTNNIGDSPLGSNDTTKSIRILFTKLLKQDQSEFAEELILATLLDYDSETGSEVSGLLTDFRTFVIETPKDRRNNLREVRLDPDACKNDQ